MADSKELIDDFLEQKNIAIVGVSRTQNSPANAVYDKLKGKGYNVFAVNPKAETFAGDPCYASLDKITDSIDGVFVATKPAITEKIVDECIDLKINRVWMHNMFGTTPNSWKDDTSVSEAGAEKGRKAGLSVISGSCPMQFVEPDIMHRCIYFLNKFTGKLK